MRSQISRKPIKVSRSSTSSIVSLLDGYEAYAAEHPDERRRITFLILAATVAKTPDVPIPAMEILREPSRLAT